MSQANRSKRTRNRIILISTLVAVALFGSAWAMGLLKGEKAVEVETARVKEKTIVQKVTASGQLQPAKQIRITADVSGEVIKLPVREGQKVKKGELLARINPDTYEASVEQATASLNNAKANLANAKAQLSRAKAQLSNARERYQRNKRLFEQEAIAKSEFQQIKTNYESQREQVEAARQTVNASRYSVKSAQASLDEARDNLRKTKIYAPINGTVSKLSVEAGERVVGTRQMEGTELMRVADLNRMQMNVDVNENDIIRIREGDTAEIEVDAFVNQTFKGIVSQVASSSGSGGTSAAAGSSAGEVTNFEVELDVLRSSYRSLIDSSRQVPTPFRPGMSGMARIRTDRVKQATAVPILAVTTRQKQERSNELEEVVFRVKNGRARRQSVTTGIQDNYNIQVKSGLATGDTVVSGPYSAVSKTLADSMKIKPETPIQNP
jgi:HlyD family secretion protein